MKILVICDDFWHPARVVRQGLGALCEGEISFDWIENAHDWSPERMLACPVTLLTKANHVSATVQTGWMTGEVEQAFADYVCKGNGLCAVHSGTAGYAEMPVLRGLLGGVFVRHPEQCPVTIQPLAGHPLASGCEPFTLKDEHYFMALDDPQAEVFLTTRSAHGDQPGAWTRLEGRGRVAVLTPGHNLDVWLHRSFQALLRNMLRWCEKND
ncbi:MAG: ThuA domain-containing protein [Chloroflexota bacterium]|nr:MAG: ThuA domain-containing protein [Chloroflexota bacterium]